MFSGNRFGFRRYSLLQPCASVGRAASGMLRIVTSYGLGDRSADSVRSPGSSPLRSRSSSRQYRPAGVTT